MSRWLYPFERRILWRRRVTIAAVLVVVFVALLMLDGRLYHALLTDDLPRLEGKDWYKAFRVVGTIWPWLFIAAALVLEGIWGAGRTLGPRLRASAPLHIAGLLILASALASGLVAEILQTLAGRLRPNQTGGRHVFRGLLERFQNSDNLGFPSSHAAVAFGAAFMVWFFWPRAGVIALIAAVLCGFTRLWSGAHFATDVFGAALVGYALARLLRPGSWPGTRPRLLL